MHLDKDPRNDYTYFSTSEALTVLTQHPALFEKFPANKANLFMMSLLEREGIFRKPNEAARSLVSVIDFYCSTYNPAWLREFWSRFPQAILEAALSILKEDSSKTEDEKKAAQIQSVITAIQENLTIDRTDIQASLKEAARVV